MKYGYLLVLLLSLNCLFGQDAVSVAPVLPMGRNSYNSFGSAVHENEVKANADYMAKNLKQYGWQYIIIDFCRSYPNLPGSTVGNPFQFKLTDGS
jgi:alpha-galactosidase